MASGLFITLEGGEGSGKSTLINGLQAALETPDRSIVVTREPGGTPLAEAVRALVLSPPDGAPLSTLATALLMQAARRDHLDRLIRPALAQGDWVICDRFMDSTRVYQGVSGEVSEAFLAALETATVAETRPDITLILDADPLDLADRRRQRGGDPDVFEDMDIGFHQAVRAGFLAIAANDPNRCIVLDALLPQAQLLTAALDALSERV